MISIMALFLALSSTVFGSLASLMLKFGTKRMGAIWTIIKNPHIIFGVVLYGLSTVVYVLALTKGEVSILFPIVSLSYIWVALLSKRYLGEEITENKIQGMLLIMMGVLALATI